MRAKFAETSSDDALKNAVKYLLIEKMGYSENSLTDSAVNSYPQISDRDFEYVINECADRLNLDVHLKESGTMVLGGDIKALETVEKENSVLFSYAYISKAGLDAVISFRDDIKFETEEEAELRKFSNISDEYSPLN
tara:strand:+ start:214 stop:624 length:411 start_codon:yes stop_codon:yes gene_type:complete